MFKKTPSSSVTHVYKYAFFDNNLVTLAIPDTVVQIQNNAFALNGMTTLTIGSGLEYIVYHAFTFNVLTSITINGEELRFNDVWSWAGFPAGLMP